MNRPSTSGFTANPTNRQPLPMLPPAGRATVLSMAHVPPFEPSALRDVQLFRHLDDTGIRRVAGLVCRVRFAAGGLLAGDDPDSHALLIVVDGTAEAQLREGDGTVTTVRELGPGEHLGEALLLHAPERSPRVVATTDVIVDQISARDFRALLAESPALVPPLLWSLGERLAQLEDDHPITDENPRVA